MTAEKAERQLEDAMTLQLQKQRAGRQESELPLVFVLPGLGGEEDPKLASLWEPARDFFTLVPVTYLDWTDIFGAGCDFAVLCRHVRRQIEEAAPTGPIRLAGYSIGGHLAYWTALELQKEGRRVESVVIFDAPVNVSDYKPPFSERFRSRLDRVLAFNVRSGAASFLAKLLSKPRFWPVLGWLMPYRRSALPFHFERFVHHKFTMQLVRRIFPGWWRSKLQEMEPLQTITFLFRSEEHSPDEREDLGWQQYCANLRVIPVAGSHRGMLDPPNNVLLCGAFIQAVNSARGQLRAESPVVSAEQP